MIEYKKFILTWINDEGKEITDRFRSFDDLEISVIEQGIKENNIKEIIKIDECTGLGLSSEVRAFMNK